MYDAPLQPSCGALLLAWYDRHARVLPWRAAPGAPADPYAVWLSEVMLQQTTVAAVKPYYAAFLARWPTVEALAAAPLKEVMRAWAGLGYYSRARNLHACAGVVAEWHGGRFPADEAALRALPGLGPYTAAAVAAIAFGRRAVVVDGNVERVIARLYAIEAPLPGAKAIIRGRAAALTPDLRAGDHAQAMMDLGATICTPKNPACAICPLFVPCAGRASGEPARFPVRAQRASRPMRRGAAFYILRADGAVLVRTRPAEGLLGGMTELPGTPWSADFDPDQALRLAPLRASYRRLDGFVAHGFTHFELQLTIYAANVAAGRPAPGGCRWAAADSLDAEALPSLMRKAIDAARSRGVSRETGKRVG
jgi:A/G-specific adenine glycosylase